MEMEGKSNSAHVAKQGEEGEGVLVKKPSFTRWLDVLDCPNPRSTPLLQAVTLLEGKIKEVRESPQEGEGVVNKKHAIFIMGMDFLDCPVCSTPLCPPIFQCSQGHFVCSACCDKLLGTEKACSVCSRSVTDRCHGMEHIVGSVLVSCSYHMYGCTGVIPYHQKAEHEKACPHTPFFCPVKGCGFTGTTAALLDHFTAQHKWPMTAFKYLEPFNVPVKVGMHVLHGSGEDENDNEDCHADDIHGEVDNGKKDDEADGHNGK